MRYTDISVSSNVYTHLKARDAQLELERVKKAEEELKKASAVLKRDAL